MIYIGIDIAKNKHDIHIFNSETGEILLNHLTILNTLDGFNQLLAAIKDFDSDLVTLGCEATGHYHFNLVKFLLDRKYNLVIVNPRDIKNYRDFRKRPQLKNDRIDAQMIAEVLSLKHTKPFESSSEEMSDLRYLTRYRSKLVSKQTGLKIEIHCLIDKVFPELHFFFSSGVRTSGYRVLQEFPSAKDIASAHLTRLSTVLSKASKGRFKKDKAIELKELATHSIGLYSRSLSFELQELIEQLDFIQAKIKRAESEIDIILENIDSPITTIDGIGNTLAAVIISEIGDINRFDSAKKLTAYAGLVPTEYQSGNFHSSNNHISKHGNRYLRSAIWKASSLIWLHNKTFHDYYTMKKNQGKHHNVVIGHITKKLIAIIFALLSNNIAFQG